MSSPEAPQVSVVVVADGPWDDTYRCLTALLQGAAGVRHELIVVDDGTTDETARALPLLPGVTAVRGDVPQGFSAAATAGAEAAQAPLVAFLHSDAEPHPGWLAPLVRLAEGDARVGVVASRLIAPSGLLEGDGVAFTSTGEYPVVPVAIHGGEPGVPGLDVLEVPAAPAVAMLVRREPFLASGGLDRAFAGPAADLDLCLRLREGGARILLAQESVAVHHGRCSGDISDADAALLGERWRAAVAAPAA